jgi:hypothetical protein
MFKIKKLWPLKIKYISLGIKRKTVIAKSNFCLYQGLDWSIFKLTLPKRWVYCWSIAHSHCHCLMTHYQLILLTAFDWISNLPTLFDTQKRHNSSRMVVVQCHKQPNAKIQTLSFLSTRFTVIKTQRYLALPRTLWLHPLYFTLMATIKTKRWQLPTRCWNFWTTPQTLNPPKWELRSRVPGIIYDRRGQHREITSNYTETDIVQTARVLTGFKRQYDISVIDSETGIPKAIINIQFMTPIPNIQQRF